MEWIAYHGIDPWDRARADLSRAMIAKIIADVNRDPKRHPQPYDIEAFMPQFGGEQRQSKDDDWKALWGYASLLSARGKGRMLKRA